MLVRTNYNLKALIMQRNQKNHIESPCGLSLLFLFWSDCVTMELGLVFRNTLSHISHFLSRIFISHFYLAFFISHFYLAFFISHFFISHFYLAFFISHFYLASRIFYLASRIFISHLAFLSRIYLHNFFPLLFSTSENTIIYIFLSTQILHKHCFQFLLGLPMVPRENKHNA